MRKVLFTVALCVATLTAMAQDKKTVQLSATVRLVLMGVFLVIGLKLGANAVALLLPILFPRPILLLTEFFRKKDDQ
mgnify:CR=1 FL=1